MVALVGVGLYVYAARYPGRDDLLFRLRNYEVPDDEANERVRQTHAEGISVVLSTSRPESPTAIVGFGGETDNPPQLDELRVFCGVLCIR